MDMRVTKYNPSHRDQQGRFVKNEWTSFSDVGKMFEGRLFTISDYEFAESNYIKAVNIFLVEKNVKSVAIEQLEKNGLDENMDDTMKEEYLRIQDGDAILLGNLPTVLKLILREYIWAKLVSDTGISITFGYDFYMYFHSTNEIFRGKEQIQALGLFVE